MELNSVLTFFVIILAFAKEFNEWSFEYRQELDKDLDEDILKYNQYIEGTCVYVATNEDGNEMVTFFIIGDVNKPRLLTASEAIPKPNPFTCYAHIKHDSIPIKLSNPNKYLVDPIRNMSPYMHELHTTISVYVRLAQFGMIGVYFGFVFFSLFFKKRLNSSNTSNPPPQSNNKSILKPPPANIDYDPNDTAHRNRKYVNIFEENNNNDNNKIE